MAPDLIEEKSTIPFRWFGWALVSGFLFSPWNASVWKLLLLLILWQLIMCWIWWCWHLFFPILIVSLIGWTLGRLIFEPWLERSGWKARIEGMIPSSLQPLIPSTSANHS